MLITDKTLVNVVAYARLLLPSADWPVADAMRQLCAATADLYDAVFYTSDQFNPRQDGDRFRDKVADRQASVDEALRATAARAGLHQIDIPQDMSTRRASRLDYRASGTDGSASRASVTGL